MLYQLHWQNPADHKQTEFIAQFESADGTGVTEWANEIIERRMNECPKGWLSMICNQDDPAFVWAVKEKEVGDDTTQRSTN